MQTKEFIDSEEALEFCRMLQADNHAEVLQQVDGIFRVNWIANKMYRLSTGKEVVDEVWTKEDGTMIVCQDLEPNHAKNIIRMMLRNKRKRHKEDQEILEQLHTVLQNLQTLDEDPAAGRILH
jgi:hypothetical protein